MNLKDDGLLGPCANPRKLTSTCWRAIRYAPTYNLLHARLIIEGWTFDDTEVQDSFGSDEGLAFLEAQPGIPSFSFPAPPNDPLDWFPLWEQNYTTYPWWDLYDSAIDWPFPVTGTLYEHWDAMVHHGLWRAQPLNLFYLGWFQRVSIRFHQLQIALCIRNAFCLDHRGRPLEE